MIGEDMRPGPNEVNPVNVDRLRGSSCWRGQPGPSHRRAYEVLPCKVASVEPLPRRHRAVELMRNSRGSKMENRRWNIAILDPLFSIFIRQCRLISLPVSPACRRV
jgi:hypothetical protein